MRLLTLPFIFAAVLLTPALAEAGTRHSLGIARDDEDRIRYFEHHQYLENGEHHVRYYDPSWEVILEKHLSYPDLPYHPELAQTDLSRNTEIRVLNEDGQAVMIRRDDGEEKLYRFDLAPDVIVDAGFDAYIRENWASFPDKPERRVRMAVAGQFRLLDMDVTYLGETRLGETRLGETQAPDDAQTIREFLITPKNWLVRLILPEIRLAYDENRRLLRYQGMSNLAQARKGGPVTIEFEHHSENPVPDARAGGLMAANQSSKSQS